MPIEDEDALRAILSAARTIAVVGASDRPWRASYDIAEYLRAAGYTVYPVNPTVKEIDGRTCYPSLRELPGPLDIVDVFRRPKFVPAVVRDALDCGAKVLWLQLGVIHEEAAREAEASGMQVVMNRCIKVDHRWLIGPSR